MRLVLVVVMVSLSGCTHVLRTGLNPRAKELSVQCKAAFPTDKSAVNWQRVGTACAPIFQRESCRDAWAQLPESPTPEQFSALTQTCARAYCDLSIRHAVTACEEWRPLWSGRPMVDLHAFVVSRELGFSNLKSGRALPAALKNGPPLQPVNPSTSGGLDKSVILEVIQSANPAIKACFEEELWRAGRTSDSLFVALSVSAVIGSTGAVTTAEVPSATEKFDALESCVANVHRSLVFPPPIGGGVVTYDFPYFLVPVER